jgi:predicted MFS family arabinose efflux permease
VAAVLALPAIAAFVLLWVQRPAAGTPSRAPPNIRDALRSLATPAFLPVLLVYMLAGIPYWGSLTFLPAIVGTGSYAILLGLGAVGQVLSGHLADRGRPARTLFAMSAVAAGVLASLATGIPSVLVAGAWGFGFLLFSLEPLQNTLVTRAVPVESRGLAFGFTFLSVFGIGSVGAVIAGALLAADQRAALFLVLAACLALSGLSAILSENRRRTQRGG